MSLTRHCRESERRSDALVEEDEGGAEDVRVGVGDVGDGLADAAREGHDVSV